MKSIHLILSAFLALSTSFSTFAQTSTLTKTEPRRIEVTGFSEIEITPDELYFTISLREYFKDEKNQKDKVIISTLEKQLMQAISEAGLPKEALRVSGVGGYQQQWEKKKNPATFLESKQYELKVERADKLDGILSKVDSRGIEYASMNRMDHSKKEEFKKQVKINALKDAREKATYLLEAINEKIGPVLLIHELEDNASYPVPMYKTMRMASADMVMESAPDSNLDYQKIKLSYRMQAVFEIK
ncbi:SIMPL domain-containing protein [Arundinibacter roseus]|uniref:DUF541 domain-containing protein n=1 Tax=Arundinibacter roseus TaxID=2070510 RepID=A0A4R4KH13_9BACT|nr:SIMPL domain-containing protein [Arundinibacter roseus]TDB65849.1 DUF541 domain-containing protein [Arundinibacter roseus]